MKSRRRSAGLLASAVIAVAGLTPLVVATAGPANAQATSGTQDFGCTPLYMGSADPWPLKVTISTDLPASVEPGQTLAAREASITFDVGDYFAKAAQTAESYFWPELSLGAGPAAEGETDDSFQPAQVGLSQAGSPVDEVAVPAFNSGAFSSVGADGKIRSDITSTVKFTLPALTMPDDLSAPVDLALTDPFTVRVGFRMADEKGQPSGDAYAFGVQCKPVAGQHFAQLTKATETPTPTPTPTPTGGPTAPGVTYTELTRKMRYDCVPSGSDLAVPLTVTATATKVPTAMAPGSQALLPFTFGLSFGESLTGIAKGFDPDLDTIEGRSVVMQLNATTKGKTVVYRFPTVRGTGSIPASGPIVVNATSTGVRVEAPPAADKTTMDLSLPSATQMDHPRKDIGGKISFTLFADVSSAKNPSKATIQTVLACTLGAGQNNNLGSITIDPNAGKVSDPPGDTPEPVPTPSPVTTTGPAGGTVDPSLPGLPGGTSGGTGAGGGAVDSGGGLSAGSGQVGSGQVGSGQIGSGGLGSGQGVGAVAAAQVPASDVAQAVAAGAPAAGGTRSNVSSDGLWDGIVPAGAGPDNHPVAWILGVGALLAAGAGLILRHHRRLMEDLDDSGDRAR